MLDTGSEGDNKTVPPHHHSRVGGKPQGGAGRDTRHCGLDPQSRGTGQGGRHTGFKAVSTGRGIQQYNTTDRIPLSLDGRGIKGEGDPVLDTGSEGESKTVPPPRHSRVGGPFIGTKKDKMATLFD